LDKVELKSRINLQLAGRNCGIETFMLLVVNQVFVAER